MIHCIETDYNDAIEDAFEPQPTVSYKEALEILLDGDCCFGVYDTKIKLWRTGIYMNSWDGKEKIMVRFYDLQNKLDSSTMSVDKFMTLKNFPVDIIMKDPTIFKTNEKVLRDFSNVPTGKIDAWVERQKTYKKVKR